MSALSWTRLGEVAIAAMILGGFLCICAALR